MAWYNNDWSYRIKLTIDATKVGADVDNEAFYIDLANMGSGFWANVLDGGGDIRITKADGTTELPIQVVTCATSTDTGEVWFKYSGTLSGSTNTDIYVYYGNSGASGYAEDGTYGKEAVWSSYDLSLNFESDYVDNTANDNDFTTGGSPTLTAGKIGNAFTNEDGGNRYIYFNSTTKWQIGAGTFTMGGWFKKTGSTGSTQHTLFTKGISSNQGYGMQYYNGGGFDNLHWINGRSGGYDDGSFASTTMTNGDWHFMFCVITNATVKLYWDGAYHSTYTFSATLADSTQVFTLGRDPGAGTRYWYGQIDAFRIMVGEMASGTVTTHYNNENANNTFFTFGDQEEPSTGALARVLMY